MARTVSPTTATKLAELRKAMEDVARLKAELMPNVKRWGTASHGGVRVSYVAPSVQRRTDSKAVEAFFASHGAEVPKREVPIRESVRATLT